MGAATPAPKRDAIIIPVRREKKYRFVEIYRGKFRLRSFFGRFPREKSVASLNGGLYFPPLPREEGGREGRGTRQRFKAPRAPLNRPCVLPTYLGIGNRPLRQIANFAVEEGGAAQLHRDVGNGVVVVRVIHSLQLVEIAEPEGPPVRRYVVGHASICERKRRRADTITLIFIMSIVCTVYTVTFCDLRFDWRSEGGWGKERERGENSPNADDAAITHSSERGRAIVDPTTSANFFIAAKKNRSYKGRVVARPRYRGGEKQTRNEPELRELSLYPGPRELETTFRALRALLDYLVIKFFKKTTLFPRALLTPFDVNHIETSRAN